MKHEDSIMPRFIVGMPRAGSTWLMRTLNQHVDTAVFGETAFWGRSFIPPDVDQKYGSDRLKHVIEILKRNSLETVVGEKAPGWMQKISREELPLIIDRGLADLQPPVDPAQVFRRYAMTITQTEEKRFWIEKTPHHINWVDRILHWLPDARFVVTLPR